MQALKMFGGGSSSSSSGGSQNQFIGMAMAQAAKLFGMLTYISYTEHACRTNINPDQQNSQGNVQSGASKQDAIGSAAQMAMKMFMSSGGSSSSSGLMSLASKFL